MGAVSPTGETGVLSTPSVSCGMFLVPLLHRPPPSPLKSGCWRDPGVAVLNVGFKAPLNPPLSAFHEPSAPLVPPVS